MPVPKRRLEPHENCCFTRLRSIPARVSKNPIILQQLMSIQIAPRLARLFTGLICRILATSCIIWAGMPVHPVMMMRAWRVNIFCFPACVQIISMLWIPRLIRLRRAFTPSLMVLRSNPRLIYLARIRCIVLGAKSSFLFLVMPRARHLVAICISTRILKSLAGGKTQWAISNLAMIFGISLAIM